MNHFIINIGILFWIPNRKENKEAGAISFQVRIPRKKTEEFLWIFFYKKIYKSVARSWAKELLFILITFNLQHIGTLKFVSRECCEISFTPQ